MPVGWRTTGEDEGQTTSMSLAYHDVGRSVRTPFRKPSTPIILWETDRVMRSWTAHAENLFFLQFMEKRGDMQERSQARRETEICVRKMGFWEKHPAFDRAQSEREMARIRRTWSSPKSKEM